MSSPPSLVPGRVTVGLPTYNRADLAVRAAQSVLEQSYPDVELLVSDDFYPGDDSEDRIEALRPAAGNKQLRILRQKDRLGLVGNFDACLRAATGEFFLLLGDDDVLYPSALEKLVAGFGNPRDGSPRQVGMAWCPCEIADTSGSPLWFTAVGPPREPPAELLHQLWAGHRGVRLSSILISTADALAVGGFEERYGDLCDIGLWAKVALGYPFVACDPAPLVRYTNHQKSSTSQASVADWQARAELVHADLITRCKQTGNPAAEQAIRRYKSTFLIGITLTILMQTVGRPGWIANALKETLRRPDLLLSPVIAKRLLTETSKVVRLIRR